MYSLQQTAAPAEEPVTLAEAKLWLRVETSADDSSISSLVTAARGMIERLSGRQLVTAQWILRLDTFPYPNGWWLLEYPGLFPDASCVRIPRAPLQSVEGVTYYDLGGTLQTLDPATYDVDAAHDPGRVSLAMNKVWPVTRLKPGAVKIAFTAGYGNAAAVPEEYKTAIKLTVGAWYENREAVVTGTIASELPWSAKALIDSMWNGCLEYGS